jgi:hypothetical protein
LSLVGRGAELGGGAHALDLLGWQVGAHFTQQVFEPWGASGARQQAQ